MVVDVGRSAQEGTWYLFPDAPHIGIRGRLYFGPDDAPYYPHPHNFWSRDWLNRNLDLEQGLGQDFTGPRIPDDGSPPARFPLAMVLNPNCPDSITDTIPLSQIADGVPLKCFDSYPEFPRLTDWRSCGLRSFFLRCLLALTANDAPLLETMFSRFLGRPAGTRLTPGTTLLPNVLVLASPSYTLVVTDGTANVEQAAAQAFLAVAGPTSFGAFSTDPVWYAWSQWILTAIQAAGADPLKPIGMVGHSAGAAANLILGARFRLGQPSRTIRCLTFGCPKPGDSRLSEILTTLETSHWATDSDPIPSIPLETLLWLPFQPAFPFLPMLNWSRWERAQPTNLMAPDGSFEEGASPIIDTAAAAALIAAVAAGDPLAVFQGHYISTYLDYTTALCPKGGWPVPPNVFPAPVAAGGFGVGGRLPLPLVMAAGGIGTAGSTARSASSAAGGFGVDGSAATAAGAPVAAGGIGTAGSTARSASSAAGGFGVDGSASPPTPPPPTVIVHDSFTDANGTQMWHHTMDTGQTWVNPGVTWTIQSNRSVINFTGFAVEIGVQALPSQLTDLTVSADMAIDASQHNLMGLYLAILDAGWLGNGSATSVLAIQMFGSTLATSAAVTLTGGPVHMVVHYDRTTGIVTVTASGGVSATTAVSYAYASGQSISGAGLVGVGTGATTWDEFYLTAP